MTTSGKKGLRQLLDRLAAYRKEDSKGPRPLLRFPYIAYEEVLQARAGLNFGQSISTSNKHKNTNEFSLSDYYFVSECNYFGSI